ncbi:hypothetical protein SCA6_008304 [Theobroma cacao]
MWMVKAGGEGEGRAGRDREGKNLYKEKKDGDLKAIWPSPFLPLLKWIDQGLSFPSVRTSP